MKFQAQRGTEDILPDKIAAWQYLESSFRQIADQFGYQEIRTPVFEDVRLFNRTAGETSDIVSKEMYEFQDKGGRQIALKPEGTAPVLRAVIEHNLAPQGVHTRLFYTTACYRYCRPARGRLRELHQIGAELIGSGSPAADAEVIEVIHRFLTHVGVAKASFQINSIGREECQTRYREVILQFTAEYLKTLDQEERAKIEKNPLGILDSKNPEHQKAIVGLPPILNYLEPESAANFEKLQELLTEASIPFRVNPCIVRGLDYYTETVFEYEHPDVPGISILGGGRYDNLFTLLGGAKTPCVGFGIGVERLLLALEALAIEPENEKPDAFLVVASEGAEPEVRRVARMLRDQGFKVRLDLDTRTMKSQMRQANGSEARFTILIGEDELAQSKYTLRNMATSDQNLLSWEELIVALQS